MNETRLEETHGCQTRSSVVSTRKKLRTSHIQNVDKKVPGTYL